MKKFLLFAIFVVINSSLFAASAKVLNLNEFKAKFYNGNVASPGFKKVTTRTILHIYADWCAPCRALGSKLDKFIDENPDFKYYKFGESKNDTLGNAQKIKFLRQIIKCECYPLVVVFRGDGSYFAFYANMDENIMKSGIYAYLNGYPIEFSPTFSHASLFGKRIYKGDFDKLKRNGRGVVIQGTEFFQGEIKNGTFYNGILYGVSDKKSYIIQGAINNNVKIESYYDQPQNLYGLKFSNGINYIPASFQQFNTNSSGVYIAKYNGKYGAINEAGLVILPFSYDKLGQFNEEAVYYEYKQKDTVWSGFVDRFGNELFSYTGTKGIGYSIFQDGIALINVGSEEEDSYIYVDKRGNNICGDRSYNKANKFSHGRALVGICDNEFGHISYGFIDRSGRYVVSPMYEDAYDYDYVSVGVAYAKRSDGKWVKLDLQGNVLSVLTEDDLDELIYG